LIALVLPPFYDTLLLGQVNLVLLLLLVLSLYLASLPQRYLWQEVLSGFLLGIAVLVKIYPITLCLAFLLHRRIIPFASMILGIFSMLIVGVVAGGGIDSTLHYFSEVLPGLSESGPGVTDQSIWPVVIRLFSFNQYRFSFLTTTNYVEISLYPIIDAPWLGYLIASIGALSIVFLTIRALIVRLMRGWKKSSLSSDFSLLITMTLLVLPVVHDHYLSLLLIPVSLVIWSYRNTKQIPVKYLTRIFLVVFCLFIALQRFWRLFLNILPSPLLLCFGFLGMLLLWVVLLRLIGSSANRPPDALESRADA
jgi:hypothetical protein